MKILIFSSLIFFIILSCTKNDTPNDPKPTSSTLVKSDRYESISIGNFTVDLTYDAQNRIILNKVSYDSNFILDYRVETEYTLKDVVENKYDELNNLVETNIYLLNSRNLSDSSIERNGTLRSKMSYDNDDHLIYQKVYNENNTLYEIRTMLYQDGNIVSFTARSPNGSFIYSIEYSDYDLNKISTLSNANFGSSFRGKSSKNYFMKSISTVGTKVTEFEFKPIYDNKGRIIMTSAYFGPDFLSKETISYY
ncbi:MAG: hypothetical protein ABIO44_10530 [Saprospiraceae bacterium]